MGKDIFSGSKGDLQLKKFRISTKLRYRGGLKETSGIDRRVRANLPKALSGAIADIAGKLDAALMQVLKASDFTMPSGDNDIFDSGELLNSQVITVTGTSININYTAPYANLIYYGGYINPYGNPYTKVYIPARPWVQNFLDGMSSIDVPDYEQVFALFLKNL